MDSQLDDQLLGLWQEEKWNIYRNALPLDQRRADITTIEGDFAFSLVEHLLSGLPFQMAVKPSHDASQRLQSLYFESRTSERIGGAFPFAVGFPLYVALDKQGEPVVAPVYLWSLTLEPGAKPADGWAISRRPFQQATYNHFLAAYWQAAFGIDLKDALAEGCRQGAPSAAELTALGDKLEATLGVDAGGGQIALAAAPSLQAINLSAGNGRLVWAGVLGVFQPHQHLFSTVEISGEKEADAPLLHSFGLLPLDSFQASAATLARQHPHTLILGPAGTGKSHLGIHLLINGLSNGLRCLVVSPRVGALRQFQQKLEQLGLGRLSFLLRDVNLDMGLFLEVLRASANAKAPEVPAVGAEYQILANRLERLKEKLDASYQASRKETFGGHSWTAIVGRYLKSIRKEGKEVLSTQLNAQDYQFTEDGYEEMSQAIASCQRLFDKSGTLRSPLNNLHPGIFLRMEKAEACEFVKEKTEDLLERALRLQHWYVNRINTYSDLLASHYEQYYQSFARRLSLLQDEIAECQGRFGASFETAGLGGLRFRSVFSGKSKEILAARQQIAAAYERLLADFTLNPYFDFSFTDADGGAALPQVKDNLARFSQALQRWHTGLREAVQEEVQRLSPKTTLPVLNFSEQVVEMESGLEGLLDQANESGLYHLPVHNKMLTIPRQQRLLDELIEQLEITRRSLPEFDDFYDWQHNWLQLNEQARRLVKALIKLRPQNWQAAFDSWFLENCLSQHYQAVLPPEADTLPKLYQAYEQMSELMLPRLLQDWHARKEGALRQMRRSGKEIAQWLAGKKPSDTLKEWKNLFTSGADGVVQAMPALLVTPHLAGELFSGSAPLFDWVLVDEAASLLPQEARNLMGLGRKIIFLGANTGIDGASEPAVYNWLESAGAKRFSLHQPHQLYPIHLLQPESFPPPQPDGPERVSFEQADGLYDEQTETNDEEALRIIGLLNRIEKTPQRTFPSVGIACFTKGQRDLIASYLLNIKQRRSTGVEMIQQLERNGLAVFQLEELAGLHFDVLIVSGTFGPIGLQGGLTAHLHRLSESGGLAQMLLLMSRAEKKILIVNSIPPDQLYKMAGRVEDKATWLLGAYFLAAWAASLGNWSALGRLKEQLPGWALPSAPYPQPIDFFEEVEQHLRPYVGPGRFQWNPSPESAIAPLRVQAVNSWEVSHYIAPEGFLAHTPSTDYGWEYEQQKRLEALGYRPLPAWSAEWWRNPGREAKRLASLIIRQEQQLPDEEE